jgi:Tol biopolymer transport system component
VLLAAFAAALALTVDGARSGGAAGLIAFTRLDGVYVMRADGSRAHRILEVERAALYGGVAWSPGGNRLALATSDGIWVMDPTGGRRVQLATPGHVGVRHGLPYSEKPALFGSPTWSPDGRRIAFTAYQGSNRDLWMVNADGTNLHRLKRTPRLFEGEVDWSPAGRWLVFDSGSWVSDVYVMRTNGRGLRNLTPGGGFEGAGQPTWSPDGRRIVYATKRGIWIMNADGGSQVRLTTSTFGDAVPDWSPNGRRIVFVRRLAHAERSGEIYAVNADGTGLTRLTHNNVADGSPAGQPR